MNKQPEINMTDEFKVDPKQVEMIEKFTLETKIGEQVKAQLSELETILIEKVKCMVWQACNDYVDYATWEPLENWKSRERDDLVAAQYSIHRDSHWGKSMRAAIFEEHKDIIIPIIKDERMGELEKEVTRLKERLDFEIKLNRSRY